jgi:hypothetical protein
MAPAPLAISLRGFEALVTGRKRTTSKHAAPRGLRHNVDAAGERGLAEGERPMGATPIDLRSDVG